MTDRELLEKAAKAAGIHIEVHQNAGGAACIDFSKPPGSQMFLWSPLEDDGDAFRLMCELGINAFQGSYVAQSGVEVHEPHSTESMRRAIVRAAAAMGDAA